MNKGEIQSNIERIRGYKKENLEKKDEARSSTERRHYQRLIEKNERAITKLRDKIE